MYVGLLFTEVALGGVGYIMCRNKRSKKKIQKKPLEDNWSDIHLIKFD